MSTPESGSKPLQQPDGSIERAAILEELNQLTERLNRLAEIIGTATRIIPPIRSLTVVRAAALEQPSPAQPWPTPNRPLYRLQRGEARFPELSDDQILAMAAHLNLEANPLRSIQRGDEVSTIYQIGAIRKSLMWMVLFPPPTTDPHLIGVTPTKISGRNQASALREYLFIVRIGIDEELVELDPDSVAYNEPGRYLPTTDVILRTKTPIPWSVKLVEERTGNSSAHRKFCERIAPEIPRLLDERSARANAQDEQFRAAYKSVIAK